MQTTTKLVYSAYSGTIYVIPEEDFSLMDMGQVPLLKRPPSNCKKCFGRGHNGRDKTSLIYEVCNCVKKVVDLEEVKKSITNKIDLNNIQ
jgi:hypothetical protein